MITAEGKKHIKRTLAGYVPSIARSASFGIGARAESLADTALQMEVAKSPLNQIDYDFVLDKLVYKVSVPDDYAGKVYEIGVYSLEADPAAGGFDSRTLSTFDSATEEWVNASTQAPATFTTTANTRVGADALFFTPAASGTTTFALRDIILDLSGYSAADTFNFAFNVGNAFTSALSVRFLTDAANYYQFNLGAQTAGYKITEVAKSTAVVTGTPDWSNINEIQVIVTSTAGGASSIEFDSMRVENKDANSLDYILVARKVLATPITKVAGQALDIEFTLDVAV